MISEHAYRISRLAEGRSAPDFDLEAFVVESWKRCIQQYAIDPIAAPRIPFLDSGELKYHVEEMEQLARIALPEMQQLYKAITGSGYAIILTNREGVILKSVCDPALETAFRGAGLAPGGLWGESHAGTNGIGTCIIERTPVTVHRDEHFLAHNIHLTCSAAPIFNPRGEMIAVLDSSSVSGESARSGQALVRALVSNSTRTIENQLLLLNHRADWIFRFHTHAEFLGLPHEALLAIGEDDRIRAANTAASRYLGTASVQELIGEPLARFVGADATNLLTSTLARDGYILPFRIIGNPCQLFATRYNLPRHTQPTAAPTRHTRLGLCEVAGKDPRMQRTVRNALRVVDRNVALLIQGETGAGKEVLARALHDASERRDKPFVAINCASIPESLIESELFGYGRGAFTGARREGMKGRIEQASGGTLFLDEIGDMPLALQTRLLRCLEDCAITPLGSERAVNIDLHVISASHRNLETLVREDRFREDLYYRLNGISLELTPLREREDCLELIHEVLARENDGAAQVRLDETATHALLAYSWPGNLRELKNVLRGAIALSTHQVITLNELPARLATCLNTPATTLAEQTTTNAELAPPRSAGANSSDNPLHAAEKATLSRALEAHQWNVSDTARSLQMSRNTLYRKLKRHGIKHPPT